MSKIPMLIAAAGLIAIAATTLDDKTMSLASQPEATGPERPVVSNRGPVITAISADRVGQFHAETLVNGIHVPMMADTGATVVALTSEDAERAGYDPEWLEFNRPIRTANGTAMAAGIVLDTVSVGGIEIRDVSALVVRPGLLEQSLLGMSFLGAISRFEIKGDQMVLYR